MEERMEGKRVGMREGEKNGRMEERKEGGNEEGKGWKAMELNEGKKE